VSRAAAQSLSRGRSIVCTLELNRSSCYILWLGPSCAAPVAEIKCGLGRDAMCGDFSSFRFNSCAVQSNKNWRIYGRGAAQHRARSVSALALKTGLEARPVANVDRLMDQLVLLVYVLQVSTADRQPRHIVYRSTQAVAADARRSAGARIQELCICSLLHTSTSGTLPALCTRTQCGQPTRNHKNAVRTAYPETFLDCASQRHAHECACAVAGCAACPAQPRMSTAAACCSRLHRWRSIFCRRGPRRCTLKLRLAPGSPAR